MYIEADISMYIHLRRYMHISVAQHYVGFGCVANFPFFFSTALIAEPSEQEKKLHELVFGKDIIAATSERQQASSVQVRSSLYR
jgi:hypothetical protein